MALERAASSGRAGARRRWGSKGAKAVAGLGDDGGTQQAHSARWLWWREEATTGGGHGGSRRAAGAGRR
jgi:hypothetical protein